MKPGACVADAPSVAPPRPPRQQLLTKHPPPPHMQARPESSPSQVRTRTTGGEPGRRHHPRHGARALNPRALQSGGVRRLAPYRGRIRRGHVPCSLRDAALTTSSSLPRADVCSCAGQRDHSPCHARAAQRACRGARSKDRVAATLLTHVQPNCEPTCTLVCISGSQCYRDLVSLLPTRSFP